MLPRLRAPTAEDWDVSRMTNRSKLHLGMSACNAELRQRVIRFAMHWPSTRPSCLNGLVEDRCTATSPSCPDGLVEGQCMAKHAFPGRHGRINEGPAHRGPCGTSVSMTNQHKMLLPIRQRLIHRSIFKTSVRETQAPFRKTAAGG